MVATNETAELEVVGTRDSQIQIVTHHFRNIHIATPHTLQELIDEWQTTCQAPFLAARQPDYTLTKLVARHVCGSVPLDATQEEAVGLAGTMSAGGAPLAPWFALVVRERTASAGRSRRGRFYFPIDDEAHVTKDTIVGSQTTLIQAYATALTNLFISGGSVSVAWRMVVHSRKLAAVPGAQCQDSSTLVSQLAVQSALTTQRSRRSRPA